MIENHADKLWRFAVAAYRAPGVADECLAAQKQHGCDVCVLLAAAFAAAEGGLPDVTTISRWDSAVASWREDVVTPLRAVRATLKLREQLPEVAALRQNVLASELEAERVELAMLAVAQRAGPAPSGGQATPEDRVTTGLRAACDYFTDARVELPRLVAAVLKLVDP
jgi:TIGR02444 family protein